MLSISDYQQIFRSLIRKPLLSILVITITALGIGANAVVFTIVRSMLFRQFPFPAAGELAIVTETSQTFDAGLVSPTAYLEWRDRNRVFSKLAAFMWWENTSLGEGISDEPLLTVTASKDFFDVLGVKPLLGRTFTEDEIRRGVSSATILSYEVWQKYFAGDPNVIGRTVKYGQWRPTIVGVMPPGPLNLNIGWGEVWHPLRLQLEYRRNETSDSRYVRVVGRLRPGVSLDQASAGMDIVQRQLQQQWPDVFSGYQVRVASLKDTFAGEFRSASLILLALTGCLLLLTCASLANMVLARSAAQEKDFAVRLALGATRGPLAVRLLLGNLGQTGIGAALGFLICGLSMKALLWFEPSLRAMLETGTVYLWSVAGICALLAMITAAGVTIPVAAGLHRITVHESLREIGRSSTAGIRRQRTLRFLVITEVALALSLLVVSTLLAKSFIHLMQVDLGFQPDHVLTLEIALGEGAYGDGEKRRAYFRPLIRNLSSIPGVTWVGGLRYFPMHARLFTTTVYVNENRSRSEPWLTVYGNNIAGEYFRAMEIPLIAGRLPNEREQWETGGVALLNASAARRLFPQNDAVGKRIFADGRYREIIGIVGDVRQSRIEEPPRPEYYHTFADGQATGVATIAIRTQGAPELYMEAVRSAAKAQDPSLATPVVTPLKVLLGETVAARRTAARLGAAFALLSLTLAAVGIYALLSFWVTQRTAEIGIRMALGAGQRNVMRLILGQALRMTAIGVAVGIGLSIATARMISSFLYAVSPVDLFTFVLAPAALFGVALFAASVPALRAIRIRPVDALRSE